MIVKLLIWRQWALSFHFKLSKHVCDCCTIAEFHVRLTLSHCNWLRLIGSIFVNGIPWNMDPSQWVSILSNLSWILKCDSCRKGSFQAAYVSVPPFCNKCCYRENWLSELEAELNLINYFLIKNANAPSKRTRFVLFSCRTFLLRQMFTLQSAFCFKAKTS